MIKNEIKTIIDNILKQEWDINDLSYTIEQSKNIKYGDFTTNVALMLSKKIKTNPNEIANKILSLINQNNDFKKNVTDINISNPGFINFILSDSYKTFFLNEVFNQANNFGFFEKKNLRYSVEYVSANPTGYLHIGHARNAVLGNVLISILRAYGYDVISEYIINDAGNQMNKLAMSVLIRYFQLFNIDIDLPDDSYHGNEIIEIAKLLKKYYGDQFLDVDIDQNYKIMDQDSEFYIRWFARGILLNIIKKDLSKLGVVIDNYFSEYEIHQNNIIKDMVNYLIENNAAYKSEDAIWLRTKLYGDDKDRVLIKSDGSPTYFMPDIIYHSYKFIYNKCDYLIDVWGADHYSYITRMKAAMQTLGFDPNHLIVVCLQMVRLIKDGKEFKMSKRSGQSLTTRDLVEAIGKDASRWFLISQSCNNHIEIDVDVVTKKDNNNPLYYVQYAHARANQLLSKLTNVQIPQSFDKLNSSIEREIINCLIEYKYTIENCAKTYEPYKLTIYLTNLAKLFHNYYANNKIIDDNNDKLNQQYYLVKAIKQILNNGLTLLGISVPEKM